LKLSKLLLEAPLRQISENAGVEGSIVVFNVKNGKKDYGYNAKTEVYENLYKAGVIDPTKVTRVALENAASIASMILTTECAIVEKPSKLRLWAIKNGLSRRRNAWRNGWHDVIIYQQTIFLQYPKRY
jgi:chaperonin GroEL (HSP60 family)